MRAKAASLLGFLCGCQAPHALSFSDGGLDLTDEIRVTIEKALKQQTLLSENVQLRQQLGLRFGLDNIVGHDYKMLKIFDLVEAVADSRTTVLMTGESGTGKSLIARAIHHRSPRGQGKPFIEVSCGSIPETLLEASQQLGEARPGLAISKIAEGELLQTRGW